ncbi:MAG: nucleoside triphosphate pyrophosphohydrolase [Planctomycetales bacterium]
MSQPTDSMTPGTPPPKDETVRTFWELVEVVARLRSPTGCPWDREQTLASIRPYTLEETFEVLEAIDADDNAAIQEELGDLLLQVLLYAQIAQDEGRFDLPAILEELSDKLIRRHPHVFGEVQAETPEQVVQHWERVKQAEKQHRTSKLEGVPPDLPALARQARLQSKVTKAGITWPAGPELLPRLQKLFAEAVGDLPAGLLESGKSASLSPQGDRELLQKREAQFGELLFLTAELARRVGVNPEDALRSTNLRFQKSFQELERKAAETGTAITPEAFRDPL